MNTEESLHPHPHISELMEIRTKFLQTKDDTYEMLLRMLENIQRGGYNNAQLVDIGFLMREIAEAADDLKKEAKVRQELCGSKISLDITKRAASGEEVEPNVQGELATGSPDVRMEGVRPKPGTPENTALLVHLGVAEELAENIGKTFHPDWNALGRLMSERAKEGIPPPPGVGKTYPVFYTTFRRKTRRNGER